MTITLGIPVLIGVAVVSVVAAGIGYGKSKCGSISAKISGVGLAVSISALVILIASGCYNWHRSSLERDFPGPWIELRDYVADCCRYDIDYDAMNRAVNSFKAKYGCPDEKLTWEGQMWFRHKIYNYNSNFLVYFDRLSNCESECLVDRELEMPWDGDDK